MVENSTVLIVAGVGIVGALAYELMNPNSWLNQYLASLNNSSSSQDLTTGGGGGGLFTLGGAQAPVSQPIIVNVTIPGNNGANVGNPVPQTTTPATTTTNTSPYNGAFFTTTPSGQALASLQGTGPVNEAAINAATSTTSLSALASQSQVGAGIVKSLTAGALVIPPPVTATPSTAVIQVGLNSTSNSGVLNNISNTITSLASTATAAIGSEAATLRNTATLLLAAQKKSIATLTSYL